MVEAFGIVEVALRDSSVHVVRHRELWERRLPLLTPPSGKETGQPHLPSKQARTHAQQRGTFRLVGARIDYIKTAGHANASVLRRVSGTS